ncbi:hypothetical protein CDEF62S_02781 [Castellaniella defragrans]
MSAAFVQGVKRGVGPGRLAFGLRSWQAWGVAMLIPYFAVFVTLVAYPVGYGLYLGTDWGSYQRIFSDPAYWQTVRNTLVFLIVAVNVKMFIALLISAFFVQSNLWVRTLSWIFVLPWAIPSFIGVLSFRWMLNAEWGMVNNIWFYLTGEFGPPWLLNPDLAMASIITVHIWKALPFWTLIMVAARLAIPSDLYEAADVDGATTFQKFRFVTIPAIAGMYLTSTALSTIWSLGDFNTVYFLTGGGPGVSTQVLATLGIRYAFFQNEPGAGMATVITALPLLLPLVFLLLRWLRRQEI